MIASTEPYTTPRQPISSQYRQQIEALKPGRVIFNPGAERMLGYSEREAVGRPGAIFFTGGLCAIGQIIDIISLATMSQQEFARLQLALRRITPDEHHAMMFAPNIMYQAAFHGSPIDRIREFSLRFIGSGEGNVAFGLKGRAQPDVARRVAELLDAGADQRNLHRSRPLLPRR